ncbi:MAG: cobalamin biosynthesis protein CbiX [Verrucomicrobiota bacterium]
MGVDGTEEKFCCLLVDNGSKRAEATLSLRRVASAVSEAVGRLVEPVSLLHSSGVDAAELGGVPAEIFEPFVSGRAERDGVRKFMVLPLFFGPSVAIGGYLEGRVKALREKWPDLEVRVAPWMVDVEDAGDERMARVLLDLAEREADARGWDRPGLALVDHGTPQQPVNAVRNFLAEQMAGLAGERFGKVAACSMERREGAEYDFNEPLLERLLGTEGFDREVVLSMLFVSPGRHAGPGGDVAEICGEAEKAHEGLRTGMTELVASHPGLVEILAERYGEGRKLASVGH